MKAAACKNGRQIAPWYTITSSFRGSSCRIISSSTLVRTSRAATIFCLPITLYSPRCSFLREIDFPLAKAIFYMRLGFTPPELFISTAS